MLPLQNNAGLPTVAKLFSFKDISIVNIDPIDILKKDIIPCKPVFLNLVENAVNANLELSQKIQLIKTKLRDLKDEC